MAAAEQLAVEPCGKVAIRIHEWNIAPGHAITRNRHKAHNGPAYPHDARRQQRSPARDALTTVPALHGSEIVSSEGNALGNAFGKRNV